MAKTKHTKEPWPYFVDIATKIHPINDVQVAIISPEDYIRARACVNACRGLDTKELEDKGLISSVGEQLIRLEAVNAELVSSLDFALGLLWRLIDKGYIRTYDESGESECDHLEFLAVQFVKKHKPTLLSKKYFHDFDEKTAFLLKLLSLTETEIRKIGESFRNNPNPEKFIEFAGAIESSIIGRLLQNNNGARNS